MFHFDERAPFPITRPPNSGQLLSRLQRPRRRAQILRHLRRQTPFPRIHHHEGRPRGHRLAEPILRFPGRPVPPRGELHADFLPPARIRHRALRHHRRPHGQFLLHFGGRFEGHEIPRPTITKPPAIAGVLHPQPGPRHRGGFFHGVNPQRPLRGLPRSIQGLGCHHHFHRLRRRLPVPDGQLRLQRRVPRPHQGLARAGFPGGVRHIRRHVIGEHRLLLGGNRRIRPREERDLEGSVRPGGRRAVRQLLPAGRPRPTAAKIPAPHREGSLAPNVVGDPGPVHRRARVAQRMAGDRGLLAQFRPRRRGVQGGHEFRPLVFLHLHHGLPGRSDQDLDQHAARQPIPRRREAARERTKIIHRPLLALDLLAIAIMEHHRDLAAGQYGVVVLLRVQAQANALVLDRLARPVNGPVGEQDGPILRTRPLGNGPDRLIPGRQFAALVRRPQHIAALRARAESKEPVRIRHHGRFGHAVALIVQMPRLHPRARQGFPGTRLQHQALQPPGPRSQHQSQVAHPHVGIGHRMILPHEILARTGQQKIKARLDPGRHGQLQSVRRVVIGPGQRRGPGRHRLGGKQRPLVGVAQVLRPAVIALEIQFPIPRHQAKVHAPQVAVAHLDLRVRPVPHALRADVQILQLQSHQQVPAFRRPGARRRPLGPQLRPAMGLQEIPRLLPHPRQHCQRGRGRLPPVAPRHEGRQRRRVPRLLFLPIGHTVGKPQAPEIGVPQGRRVGVPEMKPQHVLIQLERP